jgi:hypothetical protein
VDILINLKWHSTVHASVKCIFGIAVNESKESGRGKQAPSWPGDLAISRPVGKTRFYRQRQIIAAQQCNVSNQSTFRPNSHGSDARVLAVARSPKPGRQTWA